MWIRVATNPDSFKVGHGGNKYIDGEHVNEYCNKNLVCIGAAADHVRLGHAVFNHSTTV